MRGTPALGPARCRWQQRETRGRFSEKVIAPRKKEKGHRVWGIKKLSKLHNFSITDKNLEGFRYSRASEFKKGEITRGRKRGL